MRFILFLLLFSSCFFHDLPEHRVVTLQKKLQSAEKERQRASQKVALLQQEVQKNRLAIIKRQLDAYEKQIVKSSINLFEKEREQLHEMIESSPFAQEAQEQLDRILRLITEATDKG